MNTIVGFYRHNDAKHALDVLKTYGVKHEKISMMARDLHKVGQHIPTYKFTAPEFGPVCATGTLGNQLCTTLKSGAISSLTGALVNTGFSEEEAEILVEEVKRGSILLSVESD